MLVAAEQALETPEESSVELVSGPAEALRSAREDSDGAGRVVGARGARRQDGDGLRTAVGPVRSLVRRGGGAGAAGRPADGGAVPRRPRTAPRRPAHHGRRRAGPGARRHGARHPARLLGDDLDGPQTAQLENPIRSEAVRRALSDISPGPVVPIALSLFSGMAADLGPPTPAPTDPGGPLTSPASVAAFGGAPGEVGPGARYVTQPGHGDAEQGGVGSAVAAAVAAVTSGLAQGHFDRAGAAQAGEARLALEAFGVVAGGDQ